MKQENLMIDPRVAIAQDVLQHLHQFNTDSKNHREYVRLQQLDNLPLHGNAQKHIDQISQGCEVCALGACFLSYIRLFNEVDINEICFGVRAGQVRAALTRHFPADELRLIEDSFEGWSKPDNPSRQFYLKHPDSRERLEAIMRNIIDNNGDFKP
jgi:hypothetical protein